MKELMIVWALMSGGVVPPANAGHDPHMTIQPHQPGIISYAETDDHKTQIDSDGIDLKRACQRSHNLYAYWEPVTLRCLDSRTGRETK